MFRYWERQDPDAVASCFAGDATVESLSGRQTIRGREAIRQYLQETAAGGTIIEVAAHGFRRHAHDEVVVTGRLRVRAPGAGLTDIPATWAVQVNSSLEICSITSAASTSGLDRVLAHSGGAAAAQRASAGLGTNDLEPTEWLFGNLLDA